MVTNESPSHGPLPGHHQREGTALRRRRHIGRTRPHRDSRLIYKGRLFDPLPFNGLAAAHASEDPWMQFSPIPTPQSAPNGIISRTQELAAGANFQVRALIYTSTS
jgi:hypothetical protein